MKTSVTGAGQKFFDDTSMTFGCQQDLNGADVSDSGMVWFICSISRG